MKTVGGVFRFQDLEAGMLGKCQEHAEAQCGYSGGAGAKNSERGDERGSQMQVTWSLTGPPGHDKCFEPYSGNNMRST